MLSLSIFKYETSPDIYNISSINERSMPSPQFKMIWKTKFPNNVITYSIATYWQSWNNSGNLHQNGKQIAWTQSRWKDTEYISHLSLFKQLCLSTFVYLGQLTSKRWEWFEWMWRNLCIKLEDGNSTKYRTGFWNDLRVWLIQPSAPWLQSML